MVFVSQADEHEMLVITKYSERKISKTTLVEFLSIN